MVQCILCSVSYPSNTLLDSLPVINTKDGNNYSKIWISYKYANAKFEIEYLYEVFFSPVHFLNFFFKFSNENS